MKVSNAFAGNQILSRPQTGKAHAIRETENGSKAHSIAYFDNSGKVSPIKHDRGQTLLSALGHQANSMTISHISLGGGLMSKKKRERHATLTKPNDVPLDVDFRDALMDDAESRTKIATLLSGSQTNSIPTRILESSYYKGNASKQSRYPGEASSLKDYKNLLCE